MVGKGGEREAGDQTLVGVEAADDGVAPAGRGDERRATGGDLMIGVAGCVAQAETSAITIDPVELEDALWAGKAEMADALAGKHDRIRPARKGAIAQTILRAWVEDRVPGL